MFLKEWNLNGDLFHLLAFPFSIEYYVLNILHVLVHRVNSSLRFSSVNLLEIRQVRDISFLINIWKSITVTNQMFLRLQRIKFSITARTSAIYLHSLYIFHLLYYTLISIISVTITSISSKVDSIY